MTDSDILNSQMPPTRRRILIALKEHGGLTADELGKELGITSVAVRQHLTNLELGQLVDHEQVKRATGRPTFVYHLTGPAHLLFPSSYDQLAIQVLRTVKDLFGQQAIDLIFEQRKQEQIERYRADVNGETLRDRLEQLTRLRQADGYMATWEDLADGSYLLHQRNCPILRVAEWCDAACGQEMALFADLLDVEITRQRHQAMGDATCSYQIRARS